MNETRITVISIIEAVLTTAGLFDMILSGAINPRDVVSYILAAITFVGDIIHETQTVEVDALHYTYNYLSLIHISEPTRRS